MALPLEFYETFETVLELAVGTGRRPLLVDITHVRAARPRCRRCARGLKPIPIVTTDSVGAKGSAGVQSA